MTLGSHKIIKVYMSKVFSFTPDYQDFVNAKEVIKGGSGYCISLVGGKEVYNKEKDSCPAAIVPSSQGKL